jgi:hypothetical protein
MHPIHEEEIMVKGTASVDPKEFCSIHKHTEQRGCASHSDFLDENGEPVSCVCGLTNEQCDEKNGWIQQEAREEMMSEVIKLLDDEFPMLQLVRQKVEGLRQNK